MFPFDKLKIWGRLPDSDLNLHINYILHIKLHITYKIIIIILLVTVVVVSLVPSFASYSML